MSNYSFSINYAKYNSVIGNIKLDFEDEIMDIISQYESCKWLSCKERESIRTNTYLINDVHDLQNICNVISSHKYLYITCIIRIYNEIRTYDTKRSFSLFL
jgi:hypothetical protein